jgi:hypothetical protein
MSGGSRFSPQPGIGPVYGLGPGGALTPIQSNPFVPVDGTGQVVPVGAASVRSAAMATNVPHWIFSTKLCHIAFGTILVVATQGTSFPFPAGAVVEYTPTTFAVDTYVAVIEAVESAGAVGNLYIGRSGS